MMNNTYPHYTKQDCEDFNFGECLKCRGSLSFSDFDVREDMDVVSLEFTCSKCFIQGWCEYEFVENFIDNIGDIYPPYPQDDPDRCPVCGSGSSDGFVRSLSVEQKEEEVIQGWECHHCSSVGSSVYKFSGITLNCCDVY